MTRRTITLLMCGCLAIVWMASLSAHAAAGYGRVNFDFTMATKLKASVSGTTANLDFDKPITQSAASIKAALPGYVKSVAISTDKHKVTLVLLKPYHLRQFTSGNSVGIDLVGEPATEAEIAAATEKKPTTSSSALKLAPKKPIDAPGAPLPKSSVIKVPAAKRAAKAVATTPIKTTSDADLLTTKPTAPVAPAVATPIAKPAATAQTPASDNILTTKHAPVQALEPTPAKEAPVTAAAVAAAPLPASNTPPHVSAEEDNAGPSPATDHKTQTATPDAEQKPTAAPIPKAPDVKATPKGPLLVTAKTINGDTAINFAWGERTGATVFKRARNIWVVFSRAKPVNLALLRSVMPKAIVNIIQYEYPDNTVLEFVTDGTLYPSAQQAKGGYSWNVTLGLNAAKPTLDTPITPDDLEGTTRLLLGAFDIAPPVRFYDPDVGDELIIVPSYESGRAVFEERNFPELSILATTQGIAIVARRHDITTHQNRSGMIVSAKNGLTISSNLPPVESGATHAGPSTTGVMMPYDEWAVPTDKYLDTEATRLHNVSHAPKAAKPDALLELVKLYLQDGRGTEASGVLSVIKSDYPTYYTTNKLALLSGVAHVLMNHMYEATQDLAAPELANMDEAWPWREVVALFTPQLNTVQQIQQSVDPVQPVAPSAAPNDASKNLPGPVPAASNAPPEKPQFHFLKYNKTYIRFYPPRIRQRLAIIAADAYLADGQEEKALAVFDTLMKDDLLGPVKLDANFALAATAEKKGETDKALELYDNLGKQTADRYNAARGRAAAARLRYAKGKLTADEAADILESVRTTWRGDALERQILSQLAIIYTDAKKYDEVLRTYRNVLDGFPNDPNTLTVAGDMSDLFQHIFLDGLDNEMKPLQALSLFYEFRELTPLGDKGDKIIQHFADRLAAIDLLDRAILLLDNQVKFRVAGQERSEIAARLALLHILNHNPQAALDVLQTTNFGNNPPQLQLQRQELTAEALMKLNKNEEALSVITNDSSKTGNFLRLDILWAMQDWPNVVSHAEDILGARQSLTEPLSPEETEVLLKLALGYTFEGDNVQLRYLRDYYANLIPDNAYKQIFDYITNDTTPLDPSDFALLAKQISHTESFLTTFKAKIAAGKLSETIK